MEGVAFPNATSTLTFVLAPAARTLLAAVADDRVVAPQNSVELLTPNSVVQQFAHRPDVIGQIGRRGATHVRNVLQKVI
jgi:hypothetical protein